MCLFHEWMKSWQDSQEFFFGSMHPRTCIFKAPARAAKRVVCVPRLWTNCKAQMCIVSGCPISSSNSQQGAISGDMISKVFGWNAPAFVLFGLLFFALLGGFLHIGSHSPDASWFLFATFSFSLMSFLCAPIPFISQESGFWFPSSKKQGTICASPFHLLCYILDPYFRLTNRCRFSSLHPSCFHHKLSRHITVLVCPRFIQFSSQHRLNWIQSKSSFNSSHWGLESLPCLHFLLVLQGKAGAIGVSNFVLAFLMISLNSMSSGSMK